MAADVKPFIGSKSSPHQESEAEELRKEHLMLDPMPRDEMNQMVMEAMTTTTKKWWAWVEK